MGDARRRGTYAERKAAPLGLQTNHEKKAWRKILEILRAPKPRLVTPAAPPDAVTR